MEQLLEIAAPLAHRTARVSIACKARTPCVGDRRSNDPLSIDLMCCWLCLEASGEWRMLTVETMKAFVETLGKRLRLFYLPSYAPDTNPDELVWKHLKADTVGRMVTTNKAGFKNKSFH